MSLDGKGALEHSWRYFQLHAAQRITVFNFFVATSGLLVAALVFALRGGTETATLSLAAGFGLFALSFVFWKLDRRVSAMIKASEAVIMKVEAECISEPDHRVMCKEQEVADRTTFKFFGDWTYGQAFRRIFIVVGAVGALGLGLGAWQLWAGAPVTIARETQNPIEQPVRLPIPATTEAESGVVQPNENREVDPVGGKTPAE